MSRLLACSMLLALSACADLRLTPEQASGIGSVLVVAEPFDEIEVSTRWTEMEYYVDEYNYKTKRTERVFRPHPVRRSGGATIAVDLQVRDHIRTALVSCLAPRYRVNFSDLRVPAIKSSFNPLGVLIKGRSQLVAETAQAAIPAGTADVIVVVRGPAGTLDYDFGDDSRYRLMERDGYVGSAYNVYLIDGRRFEVLARSTNSRSAAAPRRIPTPHAVRLAENRFRDEDLRQFRESLLLVIEGAMQEHLVRLGLLPDPSAT